MTTYIVVGDVPENHLRSFSGVLGIQHMNVRIIRPGQDFLDAYAVMDEERRQVLQAAREYYTPLRPRPDRIHPDERLAENAYNATRKAFIDEFIGAEGDVHFIEQTKLDEAGKQVTNILERTRSNSQYSWGYTPTEDALSHEVAKMDGYQRIGDHITAKYALTFSWRVFASRTTSQGFLHGPRRSQPTVVSTSTVEEWEYQIPMSEEDSRKLSDLIGQRNELWNENSYGLDHDSSHLEEAIHDLCARIG